MEKVLLPEKYYLGYFNQVTEFVQNHSGHLLALDDLEFLSIFSSLGEDSKLLFLRLYNRKGPLFRIDKIHYQEIENIKSAWDFLFQLGWIEDSPNVLPEYVGLFTLSEWKLYLPDLPVSIKKNELTEWFTNQEFLGELKWPKPVIAFNPPAQVHYIKFLFFGNLHTPMTEFVVRDIGHIVLPTPVQADFVAWYDNQEEAKYGFFLYSFYPVLKQMLAVDSAKNTSLWLETITWYRETKSEKNLHILSKLCYKMGQALEKESEYQAALHYYTSCKTIPTIERQIRLLEKMDRIHEAIGLAEECLAYAQNASEWQFAKDYLQKKSKRILRSTSEKLKNTGSIDIRYQSNLKVEDQALAYYKSIGFEGRYVENFIWKDLFGLVFWDILFAESNGNFHHPLQRIPSDLFKPNFFSRRQDEFVLLLEKIKKDGLEPHVKKNYQANFGKTNPLVAWHEQSLENLQILMKCAAHDSLLIVLKEMAKNLKYNSTGFPDLLVWRDQSYCFIEIKSPNDHLSAQQLFWLDFLQENGIPAEVVRLTYI